MPFLSDPVLKTLLILLIGAAVGGVIGWLTTRYRSDRRHAADMAEKRVQIAGLTEALQAKTEKIEAVASDLEKSTAERQRIHQQFLESSQAEATAQGRLERLAELEKTIIHRDEEIVTKRSTPSTTPFHA